MILLSGSGDGHSVLPRDTEVIREAACEEEEGGTSGGPFNHRTQACVGCLSGDEAPGSIQGGSSVSIFQEQDRREGDDTLFITGRVRWSISRLGTVFPVEKEKE